MKTESNKSKWQKVLTWFFVLRMRSVSLNSLFRIIRIGSSSVFNLEPNADKHSTTFDKVISVSLSLGCKRLLDLNVRFWGFWPFLTGRCFQSRNDSVVVLSRGLVVELSSELSNESLASSVSLSVVSVFNWHVSIGVEELKLWKRIKPNQKSCHRPIFGASSVLEWAEDIMTFREGYYWANSNLSLQDLKYLGLSKPTDVLIDKSTL